jgi:uncharacterized caspase-like protein
VLLDRQATRAAMFGEISAFMHKKHLVQPTSINSDEKPSGGGKREFLRDVAPLAREEQSSMLRGHLLIISLSTHGLILPETEELYLVPYDYDPANGLGTGFSTTTLISALSTIARMGGKVLLILDACHAGGINFDISKYSGLLAGGRVSCLSSCSSGEQSYEMKTDGKPGGVFTHYLTEGLRGGAAIKGGKIVTLRDLYDYTSDKVSQKYDQHPQLIGTLDGNTIVKNLNQ